MRSAASSPGTVRAQDLSPEVSDLAVTDGTPIPDVSVIVACLECARSIDACLTAITSCDAALMLEVVVVDASRDSTAARVRQSFPEVAVIQMPAGTLTPVLWSKGISVARGSLVGLTTGHCVVSAGWATSLLTAVRAGAAGAGGPLELAPDASLLDAAIYFVRYSAFMAQSDSSTRPAREIAGDNAMYAADSLERHKENFADGFWEVEFHEWLRREGGELAMVPGAVARFGNSFPIGVISRHRFRHGRHFGAWRVRRPGMRRARILFAAPIVPLLLMARVGARVMSHGGRRWRFVMAAPLILWLFLCWAAGEATGAMEGQSADRR